MYNPTVAPVAEGPAPVERHPHKQIGRQRRMAFDAATIARMKVDYEESDLTVVQIGAKYGCSTAYVCKLAKLHGWKPRSLRIGRAPAKPKSWRPRARTGIARRLCKVINKKLDQMETDMQSGELSSADLERDAKSVASMIGGMEKVVSGPDEDKERTPRAAAAAGAVNDVERIHREIIERFERIQRRREAERGSGGA